MANEDLIPIQNLYYILCYAWNKLEMLNDRKVNIEDCPNAMNLLARIFEYGINKLVRSSINNEYIEKEEELSTLKGKINIPKSINNMSFMKRKLICVYDEYHINNPFNQIVKYTFLSLIKNKDVEKNIKNKLKKEIIYFDNVDLLEPTANNLNKLIFNRNNSKYRMIIDLCVVIYNNTHVNEETGTVTFKDFYRNKQMATVFEKFILNFYRINLDETKFNVISNNIRWSLSNDSEKYIDIFDIDNDPPNRRTDIVIQSKERKYEVIMDAKYYENIFTKAYMNDDDEKIRTSHINQVRGYLLDSKNYKNQYGVLIYPTVTKDLEKGVLINFEDYKIVYKTLNLNRNWEDIEDDLLIFRNKFDVMYDKDNEVKL